MAATTQLIRQLRGFADEPSDAALLQRFVGGDTAAFRAIVERHGPMVLRVCRRTLAEIHDAEDAFQATFLVLARRAASVSKPGSLAAWLHGVAFRVATKARHTARPLAAIPPEGAADPRPDPLAEISARELLGRIDAEVQRLPDAYRLPVVLCCLEGLSQEEAARRLGWSPGSLKGRLERGRARLHRQLQQSGLTLSAFLAAVELSRATAPALPPGLASGAARAAGGGEVAPQVARLAEGVTVGTAALKPRALALLVLLTASVVGLSASLPAERVEPAQVQPAAAAGEKKEKEKGNRPGFDRHGDPLPLGAAVRLGTVRWRHGGNVGALAFTPDGKAVAASASDGSTVLWDVATGLPRASFGPSRDGRWSQSDQIAVSPDGKLLAVGHHLAPFIDRGRPQPRLAVHELPGGKEVFKGWEAKEGSVVSVAFSPDGKTLAAAADDGEILLWDTASRKERTRFTPVQRGTYHLTFTADSKGVMTARQGEPRLDVREKRERKYGPGDLNTFDAATGKGTRRVVLAEDSFVSAFSVSPDRVAAAVLIGPSASLVRTDTGKKIRDILPGKDVRGLFLSPDGKTLAVTTWRGTDKPGPVYTVTLLDAATGQHRRDIAADADVIAFSPDGKLLATAGDHAVRLWDAQTGEPVTPINGHTEEVHCLAFSPDGKTLITGGDGGMVHVWDALSGEEKLSRRVRPGFGVYAAIGAVGFLKGRPVATPSYTAEWTEKEKPEPLLWDVKTRAVLLQAMPLKQGSRATFFRGIAFDAAAAVAAAGAWDEVILFDLHTGKERRRLKCEDGRICEVRIVDGGHRAVTYSSPEAKGGPADPVLTLWDTRTGKRLGRVEDRWLSPFAVSPDGRVAASGTGTHRIQFWDLETGKPLARTPELPRHRPVALAFSPNGRRLAWGDGAGGVHLNDVETGAALLSASGHRGAVTALAFDPSGRRLASASRDTTVLIWDLAALALGNKKR